jgi:hypothetical protein
MIRIFDNWIYYLSSNESATRFHFTLVRKFLKLLANILLPLYLSIHLKLRVKKNIRSVNPVKVIVSLTSFPKRINKTWISITSILLQKNPPDRIVLWLSSDEFTSLDNLPKSLLVLKDYGLEIKLCPRNKYGHKKYFHIEDDMKKCIFITIDDDVIYRDDLLENLLSTFSNNNNLVCATVAHKVVLNGNNILPYTQWIPAIDFEVGNLVFPVGAGAILYPPNFFNNFLFESETIDKICLFADDIWLFAVSRYMGFNTIKSNYKSAYLPILYFSNSTLFQTNVRFGKNNSQLMDVVNYFKDTKQFDLIEKLQS